MPPSQAFQVNTEAHLQPVLCSATFDEEAGEVKTEVTGEDRCTFATPGLNPT